MSVRDFLLYLLEIILYNWAVLKSRLNDFKSKNVSSQDKQILLGPLEMNIWTWIAQTVT